jgi:hypothetical protein
MSVKMPHPPPPQKKEIILQNEKSFLYFKTFGGHFVSKGIFSIFKSVEHSVFPAIQNDLLKKKHLSGGLFQKKYF